MAKRKKPIEDLADEALPDLEIPLPETGIGSQRWWNDEVDLAQKRRAKEIPRWKKELDAYRDQGQKSDTGRLAENAFSVNVNYANTEQKKNQLFYKTPGIQLKPLQTQIAAFAPAYQKALNAYLGPKNINAKALMDEVTFDELVPSGLGATKIGYECVKVDGIRPTGRMIEAIDPATGLPTQIPATNKDGTPETETIKDAIKVFDRFYWSHIDPDKFLKPVGFYSMNHDEAPWLGFEFDWEGERASRTFNVGAEAVGDFPSDQSLAPDDDKEFARETSRAIEIWYRAYLIDPTVKNPELYRRLVLIKGRGRSKHGVVVHENAYCQRFNENGQFVGGMIGSPLHVFSLRTITKTAYPPSDCQMTRKLREELSQLFRIFKKQRQRSIPLRGFDKNKVEKKSIETIKSGEHQEMIPFDGPPGDSLVEIARANLSPETFEFVRVYRDELARMWALGSNQQGAKQETGTTATESALIQQWVETRLSAERERTLQQFVLGVEKLSACVQLYADQAEFVRVLGEQDAAPLAQWDRQGRFEFEALPDSSIHVNAQENQALQLRKYNLLANDPFVNRMELIKGVALAFNDDPTKLLVQPQPKGPEPPKVALSLKGEDLINPAVLQILKAMGIPVPEAAVLAATIAAQTAVGQGEPIPTTEHGGAAEKINPIDKKDSDLTGQLSGPGPVM